MHTDPETKRFPLGIIVAAVLLAAAIPFAVFAQDDDETVPTKVENPPVENPSVPEKPKGAINAAAFAGAASAASPKKDESTKDVFFNKGLWDEKSVPTPKEEEGKTLLKAMEEIASAAGKTLKPLGTNVLPFLAGAYERPSNAADDEDYAELLHTLLPDEAVDIYVDMAEDSNRVYVGLSDEIDRRRTDYDVRKLAKNHTRISIVLKDVTLYDAVLQIADLSKANIVPDYMEEKDKVSEVKEEEETVPLDAGQIAAPTAAPKESQACRVSSYSTQGDAEWRNVLRSVLDPHDYAFDEKNGIVRVAKKSKFVEWAENERNAVRMEMRYVRVYHANPEDIVAKLKDVATLKENSGAFIRVAPYLESGEGVTAKSYRNNLSSSSTSLSTGNTQIGDSGGNTSSSWGNLLRPKNPPAILLYDNPGNLDRLESLVRMLDVREKQVLIEAVILSLSDDGSRKLGMKLDEMGFGNIPLLNVNWQKTQTRDTGSFGERVSEGSIGGSSYATMISGDGAFGTDYAFGRGGSEVSRDRVWALGSGENSPTIGSSFTDLVPHEGKPERDAGSGASAYTATINSYMNGRVSDRIKNFSAILGPLNFRFIFEMVQEDKYGKLLSSPVLTVGDHNEAVVHVGKVIPILKIEANVSTAAAINSVVVEDIDWMELVTGIMMWVGPEVSEDGKSVRLWVHPRISEVDGDKWETYKEMRYPHLVSEELDTRVTVPSGSTLLLGGLTKTSESETIKRVPLLGDIPLLGRLFRWNSRSSVRENLVILIRPTVLDDDNPNTEFEAPAMKIADPMMEGSGRTLVDVAFKDEDDPMKRREKAILEAVGLAKKDDASASAEADAEASEGTTEASAGAAQETTEAAADSEPEGAKGETPDSDISSETPPPAEPVPNSTADDLTTT